MLTYTIRNPKTGETLRVLVTSENEETEFRNLVAVCGWEVIDVDPS